MESKIKAVAAAACLLAVAAASGCPTAPVLNSPANNNTNVNTVTPKRVDNVNMPETANPESSSPIGSLATPSEAYKTAFAIRQKKDHQAIKRVLSAEIIEFFTEMGKVQEKSLDDMMKELVEKPQSSAPEVRNEKITGDRAILEFKDEKGGWKEMDFVKEGGEWKLTLPKADSSANVSGGTPKKP